MTATPVKARRSQIRRSSDQWRDLFVRFRQGRKTREQFCSEQGLSLSSFDRWRAKLRKVAPTPSVISEKPAFVEFKPDPTRQPATPAWDIELQLGADVFLRLRRPC